MSSKRDRWYKCLLIFALLSYLPESHEAQNLTEPLWVNDLVPSLLRNIEYGGSPKCTTQGAIFSQHLKNRTLWAVTMRDSSTTTFDHLVTRNQDQLGSFDPCLAIQLPDYDLYGRYCIVSMEFSPSGDAQQRKTVSLMRQPGPFESAWNLVEKTSDPRASKRGVVNFAQCIPSGCDHDDLKKTLVDQLAFNLDKEGISVNISLDADSCMTAEEIGSFDVYSVTFMAVLGIFACLVISVSIFYDTLSPTRKNKFKDSWMASLSLLKLGEKLTAPENVSNLRFISGMKVLTMILIITGHRFLIQIYSPAMNNSEIEQLYGGFWETIVFNGTVVVNTFLYISGFLVYLKLTKEIEKRRPINVLLYIYHRWFRVSIIYVITICYAVLIMPHVVTGPNWKSEGMTRSNSCRKNWWIHLLYINNYVRDDEECMLPAWYLAIDMQLFIMAVLVGYITSKYKSLEWPLLSSLCAFFIVVPTILTYSFEYGPTLRLFLTSIHRYWLIPHYISSYTKTHMRGAPYVIGMMSAKAYNELKKKNFNINKGPYLVMEGIAIIIGLGTLLSAWPFFGSDLFPSDIVSAIYSTASKLSWSLVMTLFVLGTALHKKGIVSVIMGHQFFMSMSKISLGALLIHPIIQFQSVVSSRNSWFVSQATILWTASGDIFGSYMISCILYFVIEGPLFTLNDYFIKKMLYKEKQCNPKLEMWRPSEEKSVEQPTS